VINPKNSLPILDNFLFEVKDNILTATASDLESTLTTQIELDQTDGEGSVAVPAKILNDILKEFPEQPLTFEIDLEETLNISIFSGNGKFSIVGQEGEEFPGKPEIIADEATTVKLDSELLLNGINTTLFAVAEDELRPVMSAVFLEFSTDHMTFVGTDSHKLIRYRRTDVKSENESSFVLPKKPSGLLKSILAKESGEVTVEFDSKNAIFKLANHQLICRLIEGKFPNYESVIPLESPHKLVIDRLDLLNSLKRVSVFSNQSSNLIKMKLADNSLEVSAQDIDFSISAYERLTCQYESEEMTIGFKSIFLIEILSNLNSQDVILEMEDSSRACIILPFESEDDEDTLMLLMPLMLEDY